MDLIQTVTGRISAGTMGYTQIHEHLYVAPTPAAERNPALRIDDAALSAQEAEDYLAAGGRTLVDCQPVGAGRDLRALREISRRSGVRIIATTGYHMPGFYPSGHWIFSGTQDALRARFLREIEEGVSLSDIPDPVFPGAVKAAIGADGPVGRFEICLRAAAGAAAQADVPLILHTEAGAGAAQAVALCQSEGLDTARMVVCHTDRQAVDYSVHEAIARTGVYLDYDTIARSKYHDDASEVALILHMLEGGWGSRLMLSLDTTAARLRRYGGAPGLDFVIKGFLPMLRGAGVSQAAIDGMTTDNPRRLFE